MTTVSISRAWQARVQDLATTMTPSRRRAARHGVIVAGILFNLTLMLFWFPRLWLWIDAEAWHQLDLNNLYHGSGPPGVPGAFRYSPAIAVLFFPASLLSWPAMIAGYLALNGVALVALTRRSAPLFLIAFPPILLELLNGNIHLFLALAVWLGIRWPAAWAFILLTKVTPGVGVLWFAGRREWRSLAIAVGVTAGIMAIGVVVAPGLWVEWVRSLFSFADGLPQTAVPSPVIRVPIAAALAYWAGRTGRAWLVPVTVFLALPVVWIQGLAILTASFPLYWERARWQATTSASEPTAATTRAVEVTPA